MGGKHGFGKVLAEQDEPVFHARWEGTVRAIFERTSGHFYNLDEFRRTMERMPPDAYLRASYYEKWLYAIEAILKEKGVVSEQELATGSSSAAAPAPGARPRQPPPLAPRFKVADRVVTRNLNPKGHTRLPRYARCKRGVIRKVNGPFPLPDSNAHGKGPDWQACYVVEFHGAELWGADAHNGDRVCIDLWEGYLEPETTA